MSRVILTDTGPLLALLIRKDPHHQRCREAVSRLPQIPLLTTWPCFTEAMYLGYKEGGYPAQASLMKLRSSGSLLLHDLTSAEVDRIGVLMEKYQSTPMDLADASLVAVAESLDIRQIFTLDGDFRIYRLANGSDLEVVP